MKTKTEEIKKEIRGLRSLLLQLPDNYRLTSAVGKLGLEHLEQISSFVDNLDHAIQSAIEESVEEIYKKLDRLMDKKNAKRLGNNLEIMYGKRGCIICGTNPELQRKMILSELSKKEKGGD